MAGPCHTGALAPSRKQSASIHLTWGPPSNGTISCSPTPIYQPYRLIWRENLFGASGTPFSWALFPRLLPRLPAALHSKPWPWPPLPCTLALTTTITPCRGLSLPPPHQSHTRVFATQPQVCSPWPMSGLAPLHLAQATWSAPPSPGVLVIGPWSETISCNLSAAIGPIGGWGVARPRDGANLQC